MNRILLSPDVMRISRRDVDVLSPPELTPDYLVVDSSWDRVQRLVTVAQIPNTNLGTMATGETVNWTAQDEPPLIIMLRRDPSTFLQKDDLAFIHAGRDLGGFSEIAISQRHYLDRIEADGVTVRRLQGGNYGSGAALFDFFLLVLRDD